VTAHGRSDSGGPRDGNASFGSDDTDGLCYAAPPVNAGECPRRRVQAFVNDDALVLEG